MVRFESVRPRGRQPVIAKGLRESALTALPSGMEISRLNSTARPSLVRESLTRGEVLVNLRHRPRKICKTVLGCLTVFANDKAVYSVPV